MRILKGALKHATPTNAVYFFSFIAGWPCVFYLMGWLPNYQINYLLLLGCCVILFLNRINDTSIPIPLLNMIIVQALAWIFYFAAYHDTAYITRICLLLITALLICLQSRDRSMAFLRLFNGWIALQVILGAIGFLLFFAGLLEPLFTFREMDGRPGYFFGLFTTNTYIAPFIRVAGFFDEPGAFAFWGIYALLLNKLFIDSKKIENILLIGLVVTFSIAYFIQAAVYIACFMKRQRGKMLLILALIFASLKLIALQSPEFDQAIFGRLEYNEETGTLSGDNRTDLAEHTSKIFYSSPFFGVGASNLADPKYGFVGANFFTTLAADGIFGFFIIWMPILYLFYLGRYRTKYKYAALILIIGFLQRPYDCAQLLYPLLTFTMCLYAYLQKRGFQYSTPSATIPNTH